ncbi:MAG: CotH kinase family protein [Lachnospiraceae bacterium]|nr:CotH kinase family protein [Lachnospiraceae bacterium]
MNEKRAFKLVAAILILTILVVGGMISYNAFFKGWIDDIRTGKNIDAADAYEVFEFAKSYEAGSIESEQEFTVTKADSLKNTGSRESYVLDFGYLDFGEKAADKIIISGVAAKESGATIRLYTGRFKSKAFEKKLPEAEAKSLDSALEECMYDISDAKLTGKKKVRLEVSFDKDAKDKVFELGTLRFVTADIPTLYFNIDETFGTIKDMNRSKDNSCRGAVFISIPAGYESEYTDYELKDLECLVEDIHGRGNSTWDCDKKPYVMKLAAKTDLFGMGKAKKWVLFANYYDKSLMRDKLAYNLACDMGMQYAVQSVFVDVVMNDKYTGSYLITEKIEVKNNRVDIKDLDDYPNAENEEIINGGYLLQLKPHDRVNDDDGENEITFPSFLMDKAVVIESPSLDKKYNEAQFDYIEDYYHQFEKSVKNVLLEGDNETYKEFIDVDSLVDFYIVHELFKNNDAFYASTFFYKDRDSIMKIGPVWDLDLSAGTYRCNGCEYPEGFFINGQYIYFYLMQDPELVQKIIDRYHEVHDDIVKMYTPGKDGLSDIRRYAAMLDTSQKMNFDKWGMGNRGWNAVLGQGSFEAEVDYLEDWLKQRVKWMDKNIESLMP